MASLVNPFNINGNYPIAGQDNDSQGFRDNFTNIKNNFIFIKQEVEDLQSKVILKSALSGSSLDNNFLGSQVRNIQTKNQSETVYDWGELGGPGVEIQLDIALGNIHKLNATGSVKINSVIKNWPAALQYSRLLLYINIDSVASTLEMPSTLTTDLAGLPGLRTVASSKLITFTDTGDYIFEFSSVDSGTTVFVRELTKGNPVFRDPNFYMAGIGTFDTPTLRLGWGNLFPISSKIDTSTKSGTDTFSVRGAVTSFQNFEDGGNLIEDLTSAGYSVAKSRTADPLSQSWDGSGESVTNDKDFIGYFNGLAYTYNSAQDGTKSYRQVAAIGMYAVGTSQAGTGGNVIIFTKQDGGDLTPAVTIDNEQNVTITGCLTVNGTTTTINSTTLTIDDKNIVLASGAASAAAASGAGITVDGASAEIKYLSADNSWNLNKITHVTDATASTTATSGALIVDGGVGIAGALNVGGTFGLTSSTEATTTTSAAFAVAGGVATVKNIIAGGALFANSTATSSNLVSGSFQVKGGGMILGNLYIGGQQGGNEVGGSNKTGAFILATSAATAVTSLVPDENGALVVKGGSTVLGNLIVGGSSSANGLIVSSTLTQTGLQVTQSNADARSHSAAFRVVGGSILHGNLTVGIGSSSSQAGPGRIFVDNVTGVTIGDLTTGGVVLGNATYRVGMSISGDINIGTATSGSIYNMQRGATEGTQTTLPLTPFVPKTTGDRRTGTPFYGAMTALGGINIFGNVHIGQPHTDENYSGGTWSPATTNTSGSATTNPYYGKPVGASSGNLIIQSGTIATNFNSGAIQIKTVKLVDGSDANGGMGIAGNLWVNEGGFIGASGTSSTYGNLVATSTTESTDGLTAPNGSLAVMGGAGIKSRLNVGGNVVLQSGTAATYDGTLTSGALIVKGATAALSVTAGGGYVLAGTGMSTGNLLIAAGTTTSTPIKLTDSASTLNTTAVAGGLELGNGIWFATPAATPGRAVINVSHQYVISANASLNGGTAPAVNTAYGIFGGSSNYTGSPFNVTGTAGSFTAAAATSYMVEIHLIHSSSSGTITAAALSFSFSGSATFNWYQYDVEVLPTTYGGGVAGTLSTPTAALMSSWAGTTAMPWGTNGNQATIQASNSQYNRTIRVRGILNVNASGTIVPCVLYQTAPAVVVQALPGSYIKWTPFTYGSGTVGHGTVTS